MVGASDARVALHTLHCNPICALQAVGGERQVALLASRMGWLAKWACRHLCDTAHSRITFYRKLEALQSALQRAGTPSGAASQPRLAQHGASTLRPLEHKAGAVGLPLAGRTCEPALAAARPAPAAGRRTAWAAVQEPRARWVRAGAG